MAARVAAIGRAGSATVVLEVRARRRASQARAADRPSASADARLHGRSPFLRGTFGAERQAAPTGARWALDAVCPDVGRIPDVTVPVYRRTQGQSGCAQCQPYPAGDPAGGGLLRQYPGAAM